MELVLRGALTEGSPCPLVLLCAKTIYIGVGINVFEVAIRE